MSSIYSPEMDRTSNRFVVHLLFALSLLLGGVSQAYAATFIVDRADDPTSGNYGACTVNANDCSFRGAIEKANANGPGADTINFGIPGSGVKLIHLTDNIPDIKSSLTINGATQSGYFGKPMVQIDGDGVNSYGITLYSYSYDIAVTIIGLSITNHVYGVYSYCHARCDLTLLGNFIGVDPTGTIAMGNGRDGVRIDPSDGSVITIGGTGLFEGNVISGNTSQGVNYNFGGINITPFSYDSSFKGSAQVTILGNKIGTDFTGTVDLGNSENGITATERDELANVDVVDLSILIGGSTASARNIIAGNDDNGIYADVSSLTAVGNYIGTDVSGASAIANGDNGFWADHGIYLEGKDGATYRIGGDKTGEGNVISSTLGDGIYVATGAGGSGNTQLFVSGNYIGTNAAGTSALGNSQSGISIDNSPNYTVTGTIGGVGGARNIISGNGFSGITVASGNISIYGNYIGTNEDGTADLGNGTNGIFAYQLAKVKIGGTLIFNGSPYDAGNLISGNHTDGILLYGDLAAPALIRRNRIGTNASGTAAIPNDGNGISVQSNGNTIGSDAIAADGNVISGNGGNGVLLLADNNYVFGNKIGTNSIGGDFLPNQTGIRIDNAKDNQIGLANNGVTTNIISGNNGNGISILGLGSTGNKIENNIIGPGVIGNDLGNQGAGVYIETGSNTVGGIGKGNTIAFNQTGVWFITGTNTARGNSIYSNDGLGIGFNNPPIQGFDFPILSVANPNSIAGSLVSKPTAPNTPFAIDFYRVDSCDSSGYGEGRYYLGSTTVLTDGAGNAQFTSPAVSLNVGDLVTATSTGPSKTSGFSPCLAVTSIPSLSFSNANYGANEGAGMRTITVTRTGGTAEVLSVDYATSNGTATAGQDYVATSGTLTFNSGEIIKTFNVEISEDSTDEADETVNLTLSNIQGNGFIGSPSTTVLTINDNDSAPNISISDVSQNEGNSGTTSFAFHVQLSAASAQTVSVNYATADGSATAPSDYTAANGSLSFGPGETDKVVSVSVVGDSSAEGNETFVVNLSNAVNGTLSDVQGSGTIVNDDTGPGVSIDDVSMNEGSSGTTSFQFTVQLSAITDSTVRVDFKTADSTATSIDDYAGSAGSLLFSPGETTKNITIQVNGDTDNEPDESFMVNLTAASNATIADSQGIGTILNDDDATPTPTPTPDPSPTPTPDPSPSPTPSPSPAATECCSLRQGAYGNANTTFFRDNHIYNGFVMPNLLNALLGDPSFVQPLPPIGPYPQYLQLGMVGTRSLTIPLAASQCIITRLAATGNASALPDFGAGGRPVDRTLDASTCQVPSAPGPNPQDKGLPLTNKGKFNNVLLGQTIALALNLRLDPNMANLELTNLGTPVTVKGKLYRQFCTQGLNPDGTLSDGDVKTFILPQSVVDAVSNPVIVGADNVGKVSGLLILANRALAGLSTGGPTLGDVNAAVDTINAGFEKCRVLVECSGVTPSLTQDAWKVDQ